MLRTIRGKEKFFFDRVLGAFLALSKGILINVLIFLVLLVISKFNLKVEEELKVSRMYKISEKFTENTILFLPSEIKDMLEKYEYEKEIQKVIEKSLGGKNNEKN